MPARVKPVESLDEEEYRDWSGEEDEDWPSDDPAHPINVGPATPCSLHGDSKHRQCESTANTSLSQGKLNLGMKAVSLLCCIRLFVLYS
jgi:hypothetical protein